MIQDFVPGSFDIEWKKPPTQQPVDYYPQTNIFPFRDGPHGVPEWWIPHFPLTEDGSIDGKAMSLISYREMQLAIQKKLNQSYLRATKQKLGINLKK